MRLQNICFGLVGLMSVELQVPMTSGGTVECTIECMVEVASQASKLNTKGRTYHVYFKFGCWNLDDDTDLWGKSVGWRLQF